MPRSGSVLVALFATLGTACGGGEALPEPDPQARRSLADGEVVGFVGEYGSHVWRGIPYARPPVGELRWRAPQPNFAWSETLPALGHGHWCPQPASPFAGYEDADPGETVGDEDCLFLDVYAPRHGPDAVPRGQAALPVMVWLHGGGNVVGSAAKYDGGLLAASQDVVVVAINYRLGPLGWFRHSALRSSGTTAADRSGNFGLLDQIRALEWVRDNVAAFGGDPSRVTVFGESAGARDSFALLLSSRARGLFHRAIVQSGGTGLTPTWQGEHYIHASRPGHRNSSGEVLARLLVADGTARDREGAIAHVASQPSAEIERVLRGLSPEDLLAAYATDALEALPDVPQMFRDGAVLPSADGLEWILKGGPYSRVPVILGTNRDENRVFLAANPEWVRWRFWLIPQALDPALFEATAAHLSRMWKATGADAPATLLRRQQGPSVYVYRFDWDEEPTLYWLADLSFLLGASHGFEVPFVFGHWKLSRQVDRVFEDGNRSGREELSARMMSYWAQFAYAGDPGSGRGGDLPRWTPWNPKPDAEKFLVLDTDADGGVRMSADPPLTPAMVLAEVEQDERLASQRQRCIVYYQLARRGRGFEAEDYAGLAGCGAYPMDAYPWPQP